MQQTLKRLGAATKLATIDAIKRRGTYQSWLNTINGFDNYSHDQFDSYISTRFSNIGHSSCRSSFYRDKYGVSTLRELSTERLGELDLLSKHEVRLNLSRICTPQRFSPYRRTSTAGTSGAPLVLYQSLRGLQAEQAFFDSIWSAAGFTPRSRLLVLRGNGWGAPVRCGNRMVLPLKGIENDDVEFLVRQISHFNPEYLHCYPSTGMQFAKTLNASGLLTSISIKGVFCGSEAIYDHQVDFLEETFGCKVIAWYGHSEQGALAVREKDGSYLFNPAYGYVEIIKTDNGLNEIATTGWLNSAMPLLRYRTGDFVRNYEWIKRGSIPALRADRILGRNQEMFVNLHGNLEPLNHYIFGLHGDAWSGIDDFVFIQSHPGKLELRIKSNSDSAQFTVSRIQQTMSNRLKHAADLKVIVCDHIDNDRTKKQYFVSKLSREI